MGKFLNGLLIGVGVGLLVAPFKGEESRRLLKDRIDDLQRSITGDNADYTASSNPSSPPPALTTNTSTTDTSSATDYTDYTNYPDSTSAYTPPTLVTDTPATSAGIPDASGLATDIPDYPEQTSLYTEPDDLDSETTIELAKDTPEALETTGSYVPPMANDIPYSQAGPVSEDDMPTSPDLRSSSAASRNIDDDTNTTYKA